MQVTANLDIGNLAAAIVAGGAWFSAHRAHMRAIQVDEKVKTINGKTIGQLADETAHRVDQVAEVAGVVDVVARPPEEVDT